MITSYYDKENRRIVQVGTVSNPGFWDNHWKTNPVKVYSRRYSFVLPIIKKFLKKGRVLEGGCGLGDKVYLLQKKGYEAIGVDYAKETVEKVKNLIPSLDIRFADVRQLPFSDEFFDGYLSLGVIEHFYYGYKDIINEMKRVLKKGGFAFVGFPFLSLLRKIKIKRNSYPLWEGKEDLVNNFYQFILDHNKVINDFSREGFQLKHLYLYDAVKGIKDEVAFFKRPFQFIYDKQSLYSKALKYGVSRIFSWFGGHLALTVFSKEK